MIDYARLMRVLSVPRPTGSAAERATAAALRGWLEQQQIRYRSHFFRLYPFFSEAIGTWLLLVAAALVLALALRLGWPALLGVALVLVCGLLNVAFGIPLIMWPGSRQSENILIEFEPPQPRREVILSAHYDSKTELLDHTQRAFFTNLLFPAIGLAVLSLGIGLFNQLLLAQGSPLLEPLSWLALLLALPALIVAIGLGVNLLPGRLIRPSCGAIDNGTACATLLGLAARLAKSEPPLDYTRVTIALFSGEEASMQGSRAYVKSRDWPLPACAINLELMAQDGPYVIWQRDGNTLRQAPTTEWLNQLVGQAVLAVTGKPVLPAALINSDGASFLQAGIPTTVLGTFHSNLKGGGLHRPDDCIERVIFERLPEGVAILARILQGCDQRIE